jgi:tyrosyl-tRNA synthetase
MIRYFELLTDEDLALVRQMHPKEAKMKLAEELAGQFHGTDEARDARAHFESVFSQKQVPDDVSVYALAQGNGPLVDILAKTGMAPSKNEARRLIKQGAVSFNGEAITDESWLAAPGILKVGKRRFLKFE